LLRLDEPLTLNTTSVGTITIPSSSYEASGLATVIGWGVTKEGSQDLSDVLLKAVMLTLLYFSVVVVE
ncbi:unnamed protein product, partial [Allacma fusca]